MTTLLPFQGKKPKINPGCFIAPNCSIIGDVIIDLGSSVWFGATIRADQNFVKIGKRVSIQDNCVVHVDSKNGTSIADGVVVGHNAIIHGCSIDSNTIIGMGAIVLSGAKIGKNCIIGAGSVITEGTQIPDNSVVLGIPGKVVRQTTDEHVKRIKENVRQYVELTNAYLAQEKP